MYQKGDQVTLKDGRTMTITDTRRNGDDDVVAVLVTYKNHNGFNQTNWWRNMANFSAKVVKHVPAEPRMDFPESETGLYYLRFEIPQADAIAGDTVFYVGGVFACEGENVPAGALCTWLVVPGDTGEAKALTREQVQRVMLLPHRYVIEPAVEQVQANSA